MIIKLTLVGLVIALIAIVASSYYVNKEGFDNITATASTPSANSRIISQSEYDAGMKLYTDIYDLVHKIDFSKVDLPDEAKKELLAMDPPLSSKNVQELKSLTKDKYDIGIKALTELYNNLNIILASQNASKPATVTPVTPAVAAPLLTSVVPQRHDVVPQVSLSDSGYKAMELQQRADLLKDIQKVVKNELLAARSTEPVIAGDKIKKVTDSMAQGQEYEDSCYKGTENRCPKNPDGTCPPVPDMSKYIKKDEIPCYGCTLDY